MLAAVLPRSYSTLHGLLRGLTERKKASAGFLASSLTTEKREIRWETFRPLALALALALANVL